MPAGDDPLPTSVWQPVPGTPEAQIYPLIRKIDTVSSNSYLIQTADAIILIDPGGLPEQAELLAGIIAEIRAVRDRPVFVILTHAHIDHFIGARHIPPFDNTDVTVFAVQETGAVALMTGDPRLTQAAMFDRDFARFSPGLRLFAGELYDADAKSRATPCTCRTTVFISRSLSGTGLPEETIRFGSRTALSIYHTPGHSPDSICIRLGGLLFIGDVLFAANPGIAGLTGWDQEALVRSLDGISALIADGGIDLVCPGHGRIVKAADAERMLVSIRTDALALENIAELNHERAIEAAEYAADCMEQVSELFTIIAGRLAFVEYVLEELGEEGIAGETGGLIAADTIDGLLDAFRTFSLEHHDAGGVSIHLALKAGQIIGKLERLFREDELTGVIDPALVRRAARLLSDYTTMLRGYSPPCERTVCAIFPFVEEVIRGLSASRGPDEDVFSATDNADAFRQMLRMRIGTRPLLEDVDIEFSSSACAGRPAAEIDCDDFTDLITFILEDLVGSGAGHITVQPGLREGEACITFIGRGCAARVGKDAGTAGFLARLCRRAGGTLAAVDAPGTRTYTISFACVSPSP